MYAVLIEKTTSDARLVVRNVDRDGLYGYMRLHKWFMESSGRALGDRRRAIMRVTPVKKEEELFRRIEEYEEEVRELEKITGGEVIDESMKKISLIDLCSNFKTIHDWLDMNEQRKTYEELRTEVMKFAFKKHTQSKKAVNSSGMDVNGLAQSLEDAMNSLGAGKENQPEDKVGMSAGDKDMLITMLNYLTKGKGKGGKKPQHNLQQLRGKRTHCKELSISTKRERQRRLCKSRRKRK